MGGKWRGGTCSVEPLQSIQLSCKYTINLSLSNLHHDSGSKNVQNP